MAEDELPVTVREVLGGSGPSAVVFVHTLAPDTNAVETKYDESADTIVLQLPVLPHAESANTTFRVPDLVWYQHRDESMGFIALLNSFDYLWLQRFSGTGEAVGGALDLEDVASLREAKVHDLNWEGLTWHEEGRRLMLIDDTGQKRKKGEAPVIVIIDLPDSWRH